MKRKGKKLISVLLALLMAVTGIIPAEIGRAHV